MTQAGPDDRYGDVVVDTDKSFEVYREWLALARPAPGPRRPAPAALAAPRVQARPLELSDVAGSGLAFQTIPRGVLGGMPRSKGLTQ